MSIRTTRLVLAISATLASLACATPQYAIREIPEWSTPGGTESAEPGVAPSGWFVITEDNGDQFVMVCTAFPALVCQRVNPSRVPETGR
jgi:hypothetical protein